MRIRRVMTGILGAAIVLIVALALPSLAHAHAGHHHSIATADAADAARTASAELDPAPLRSQDVAARPHSTPAQSCDGVTCCSKACSACGIALGQSSALPEPLWSIMPAAPADLRVPAAADPDDLSKPPRRRARA